MRKTDLLNDLYIPDRPPQWQEIPVELARALAKPVLTPAEARKLRQILAADWLLLRNVYGFKCRQCGAKHAYFTRMCVERPFNRLNALVGLIQEMSQTDEVRARKQTLAVREHLISGMQIGTIDPITPQEAQRLLAAIEAKRGGLIVTTARRPRRRFV